MKSAELKQLPSRDRPLPLQMRGDLTTEKILFQGEVHFVIKDSVGLNYHRLMPEQYRTLEMLDGHISLDELKERLRREFPARLFDLQDTQRFVIDLHQKGLLISDRPGQGVSLIRRQREQRWQKTRQVIRNLLFLRLPGWDPEPTLKVIYPCVKWTFHPLAIMLAVIFVISSWVFVGVQFGEIQRRIPEFQQFFGWPNLLYLWIVLAFTKVLHEFGHGLSCHHFKGECHEMGLMLLVFSPTLYCDVTDSWMMHSKWKRIAIAGAGMYVEVLLSAVSIFLWWHSQPGLFNHLCLNIFFVTMVTTVIFNANPLMRYDGYYMLADFLEIPNLRPKANEQVRNWFSWYCLGIEQRPNPFLPQRGKVWFFLYAVAATLYRLLLVLVIATFLYTVLKPYGLQSIGATIALFSIGGMCFGLCRSVYKILSAPRSEPMSFRKLGITLAIVTGSITGVMFAPIGWHLEAPFVVEPHQVRHVYSVVPGRVREISIQPGDRVTEEMQLVWMENEELEDQLRKMYVEIDALHKEVKLYRALDDVAGRTVAEEKLAGTLSQLNEFEQRVDQLIVTAPLDGRVVAPNSTTKPVLREPREQLASWSGSPLSSKNRGTFLEPRTHLLSIAPNSRFDAILYVDQAHRDDLDIGKSVELKFDAFPNQTFQGRVRDISHREEEFVPLGISNKTGGELPTVTDAQGREQLASVAYRSTVFLEGETDGFVTGMRGRARFLVEERTIGEWIWRYLRRTFFFRL